MAVLVKAVQTPLVALQSVAANSVFMGTAVDVSTRLGGLIHVRFGRRAAAAAGAGVNIRLESSSAAAGNNTWFPFAIFTTNFAVVEAEAISVDEAAGQTVLSVASTANLAAGDVVYIDNTTRANSEWLRIVSIVANVSITVEDPLVNAQPTTAIIYDGAEIYSPVSIPEGCVRIRAVIDGSLFTQAFAVQVFLITVNEII